MDRSKSIYSNDISSNSYKKAVKNKNKYLKKYGNDEEINYFLKVEEIQSMKEYLGIKNIVISNENNRIDNQNTIIIGNIRMGFGHYRISMAIASAAKAMGYTPYWMDLHSYKETTGGKVIDHLNELYSLGSRLSQKYSLFNKFYWEPLNSEGFKKLSYNAMDQKVAELMVPIFKNVPKDIPFIATHVWPAQAAVHSGMDNVVNVIPDNWPMALHLAEGSIHTVQTSSAFLGYKTLKGMSGTKVLNPIPDGEIFNVGHYIDHELVSNIEVDCKKRVDRVVNKKAKRILITVGGAGAQKDIYVAIIKKMLPEIKDSKAVLYINVGDHKKVYDDLCNEIPELRSKGEYGVKHYVNDWHGTCQFAQKALDAEVEGIHIFYNEDIFSAVYGTNLLMRSTDLCITKPSELAFYPVPKLLIKRVGGHEAYGALRASEIGDGTIECETTERAIQMLELIIKSNEILTMFCENILKAKEIGVYDGAYKVIEIATRGKKRV